MSRFVLVHGAWHGAWCWEKVVPLLTARGHPVRAIDLPGHGDDPAPPGAVGFDDYMTRMGVVLAEAGEPPILVGHSLGGAVITGAADRWPERIRALVYLCAILPDTPDAMSRFRATEALMAGVRPAPDGSVMELDPGVVRDAFYHDCSDADAMRAAARLRPQPARGFQMTFELAPERFGRVPRHYVACTEDRAIDLATQRAMYERMPCTVHALPASHSPFYSMPERLADVLERLARS
jgi:pimeloyl-ACP methyl ester carboxylesterase